VSINEDYEKIVKILDFIRCVNDLPQEVIFDMVNWDKFYEEKEKLQPKSAI
jgi:hypothetical protein